MRKKGRMSEKASRKKWTGVMIRKELYTKIKDFLATDAGKELGFTNPTQLIDDAVREFVRELIDKRFQHINTYEDKVRVLDNQLGKNGDIVTIFFKSGTSGYCDHCRKSDCVHVKYSWEIPEVARVLKKHGLKPPIKNGDF